ncbi:NADP-dependent oxidoreductase [Paenibacillus alvei]|uniref:NADP-dependent oxidoreductase n=1 Tax=Paenibacillus alvei TaxID=44250 RepID=A0ABT4GVS7_PAEAL|nr:NADP-dependent oxidoreductase [Paenibacillus alvei]MCY7484091.1 NADP-dependent oxidoreductase [Paenibacillus alvei]MCY9760822.1 NADP-dependent oxidoreductase [Paenibacillus alvei]MCY9769027.1 NADP-dependent oxidoreductase [Paenibacillus alvei]
MIGIGIENYGDESALKVVHVPTEPLGSNDLLISIKASGVNPVDWKVREGHLKESFPYKFPLILGWDAAGKIAACGTDVKDFQVGDNVFFRPEMEKQGTYADEIIVPANLVAPMPRDLTYVEAASLPLVGLTVWQALVEVGNVQAGDSVLILAGSGGIGSFAIQLAKALGAHVTTTTSAKNIDFVKELGADKVIAYDQESIRDSEIEFDFMLDTLGGSSFEEALTCMKLQSTVATIFGGPNEVRPDSTKKIEVERQLNVEYVFTRPDGENMNHIRELVELQKVRPIVGEVYPMTVDGVRRAHLSNQTGRTRGKIVLSRED